MKIKCFGMLFMMAFTLLCSNVIIAQNGFKVYGDVNCDGETDVADYVFILNCMADEAKASEYPTADVNGDGDIDVADATYVLNIMAETLIPVVTIYAEAENVTSDSFTILAELTELGGTEIKIISHGICWSENQNPTINDSKTDNGEMTSIGTFKSTATGLKPNTMYYVRAYAANQFATSYSEQITVTTQESYDKWDGKPVSSFAGGSGSSSDPYIIENGGQLLHIKDINSSNKYFELANNIDLDNRNWLPFEFKGTLDGKGHTISNLRISRETENQGLFSEIYNGGKVQNLTIKNVNINAPTIDYIGALAGYSGSSSTISNCYILLTSESHIAGKNCIGGLIGKVYSGNVLNCSVEYSGSLDEVIKGNNSVGGLAGAGSGSSFKSCHVHANIKGSDYVGGIIGKLYESGSSFEQCAFKGSLIGNNSVGGIVGLASASYSASSIFSCKADVDLTATIKYGGGIIGAQSNNCWSYITSCYATGTMNSNSEEKTFGGISGTNCEIKMCYSTISSEITNFDGFAGETNTSNYITYSASVAPSRFGGTNKGSCRDITTWLQESYQIDGDYGDFDNTWTWSGVIDGQEVNVSCPRLSWE